MANTQKFFTVGRVAVLTLMTLAMTACSHQNAEWSGSETEKRNAVEMVRLTHDVKMAANETQLSSAAAAELVEFLNGVDYGYGDRLVLDSGDSAAAGAAVTRYLNTAGYAVAPSPVPLGAAAGAVRVAVERYVVTLPSCPDWRQKAWPNYENAPSSNFGCANATALGLMVANPRDLIEGDNFAGPDGAQAATAIERYHADKVKWPAKSSAGKSGGGSADTPAK
ncbi:MAG: hypothetical protein DCC73_02695 [Proteobacteria bacterium]|nr:MAG: hypothetical protein DCC73_02695 [Pseudomonadota bacterium]